MGCLWEQWHRTDRTSPSRQKRIPIPTGQITVRRNRKDRRPIRLQSPWKPYPQARQKDRKRKKKQSERQQKHPKTGHRKPHPRQIRSPRPEYLCKTHTQSCIYTVYHTLRLSQTVNQSEANDFTFGAQNGDDRPGTENGTAENGKRQASGPRKYPLRTASRIYLKEKRDTSWITIRHPKAPFHDTAEDRRRTPEPRTRQKESKSRPHPGKTVKPTLARIE